ncbi:MAG TPA: hypothetical protein VMP03_06965, partial [Methylomirabilota bacterium]|nr:hypothetical protein [Methylomirabilota bacterium]
RRDPVTVERGVRVDLADAARRVRRELDATVLDLSHFRRGTQQAAAESWTAVRDEVSETTRGLVDDLRAATRPIRRAAERSGDRMDSLAATVDTLSLALDGLARRIDMMADPELVADGRTEAATMAPLATLIEGLGDRLDAHADRLTAVADALAAMERRLSVLPPRAVVTDKGGQPEEAAPVRERIS